MATPADPQENTRKMFEAIDIRMMKAHRRGDDTSRKNAEETATILLTYPELPLVIRARACMVLGCSDDPGFLEHAKEGVRIAELGNSLYTEENARAQQLLKHCKLVLTEAQEEQDRRDQEMRDREVLDEEVEDEEDPEDAVTMMTFDEDGNVSWVDPEWPTAEEKTKLAESDQAG